MLYCIAGTFVCIINVVCRHSVFAYLFVYPQLMSGQLYILYIRVSVCVMLLYIVCQYAKYIFLTDTFVIY